MNDALYDSPLVDPLSRSVEDAPRDDDFGDLAEIIKGRAEDYLARSKEFDGRKMGKMAEAHEMVYKELYFLAGMIANNKIGELKGGRE